MPLKAFISENRIIERIEIVSFENTPPQIVGLVGLQGRTLFLVNEMRDLKDGTELGTLRYASAREHPATGNTEHLPGGSLLGFEYLRPAGFDDITGVKINISTGDLTITTGDAPYSLFVRIGGRPEFPIKDLITQS